MLEVHKYYTEELFEKQINCLMTAKEEIISVSPGDDIDKVVKTFLDTPVHRILVMEKGEAVGIISTKDALKALSKACKKEKQ
jgi:CBS domain containing-hemolysin-like protein